MAILDELRDLIPARARGQFYAVGTAVVAGLVVWGVLAESYAPAIAGAVIAAVELVFAILHSTSSSRSALYGFAAAIGVVAVAYGAVTDAQVEALLAVLAPVLGLGIAAAKTPVD